MNAAKITNCRRRERFKKSAVTLIETLVALAMLAVIAPILGRCWHLVVWRTGVLNDRLTATQLGEQKLLELVSEDDSSSTDGDFSPDYPRFSWQLERASWDADDSLQQWDMNVYWADGQRRCQLTLTTLVPNG